MAREKLKMRRHDTRNVLKWRAIKTPIPWDHLEIRGCCLGKALCLGVTVDEMCGRLGQEEASFFFLLFNILKCDERINKACLPDPYVPFSAARA